MRKIAKYTGKDMQVFWNAVEISGQGRQLEINESVDEVDVTTYGSVDKEFIYGMMERDGSLEVLDDNASSAIRGSLTPGNQGTLTWFPQGSASTKPQHRNAATGIRTRSLSYPYDDAVMLSVDVRLSGPVVESTVT